MAELTIVFRLRFAVALTVALGLLLVLQAHDASALDDSADEYIVQMESGYSPSQGEQIVAELGGQVTTPDLPVINGFGAMLQDDVAEELESRASVRDVTLNSATTLGDETVSGGGRCPVADATTRATTLRPNTLDVSPLVSLPLLRQPLQYTVRADKAWWRGSGRGVGVAVVDTGIAGDLPDFYTGGQSRVIASAVTNPCAKNATDNVGHGTHVAGLIAGNSLNYPGLKKLMGRYMGVAPRANLVSVKVSDDDGDTTVLDVINGLQFVVDNKDALGIRVVNLSLSSSAAESYRTDPLDAAVEAAWFSGIVVVAAAGNDGDAPNAVSYAPGNDPFVITAGALDDRGSTRLDDDALAPWSSRGMTQDGVQKPEVLAPGNRLVAALAPKSDFERLCRRCVVGKNYFRLSGTSMSSAVVSGVGGPRDPGEPGHDPEPGQGRDPLDAPPGSGCGCGDRRERRAGWHAGPRTAASPPTR